MQTASALAVTFVRDSAGWDRGRRQLGGVGDVGAVGVRAVHWVGIDPVGVQLWTQQQAWQVWAQAHNTHEGVSYAHFSMLIRSGAALDFNHFNKQ